MFNVRRLGSHSFLALSSNRRELTLLTHTFIGSPSLVVLSRPLRKLSIDGGGGITTVVRRFYSHPKGALVCIARCLRRLPTYISGHFRLIGRTWKFIE